MGELSFRVDRGHHHNLTEQVERGLRHAILTGGYAPGDCLPTLLEMAAQLGVSEIVVRRAVKRLSDEGLVKGRTRSGIRVCDFRRLPWRAHVLYLHWSGANMYYHSVLSATMNERLQADRVLVTLSHLSAADAMHDFCKVQTLLDTQPRERLAEVLGSCDVAIVPLAAGMSRTSFPSKIYTIMASGRPMIAALDPGSDARRFVEACACGLVIDPDDGGQMLAAIRTLKRDVERAARMGEQGRLELEKQDLRESSLAAYEQVLEAAASHR